MDINTRWYKAVVYQDVLWDGTNERWKESNIIQIIFEAAIYDENVVEIHK